MNNFLYNENNIELFNYYFTSIYKFDDLEKFEKLKNSTYDDLQNFVDEWLNKDKSETEIIVKVFLDRIELITRHDDCKFISVKDHKNLIKIKEYLEEKIEPKIIPLELHVDIDTNSFVYLFRLLQENRIINNTKPELENILFALLRNRVAKNSINRYLSSSSENPKSIFKKAEWNDLF